MIKGTNISKSFDGFKALDGTTFHVKKGSVYGLVGPNGAGKSTLLRHIVGVFKCDEGSITIDDEDVFENIEQKKKMVFIPDEIFYYRTSTLNDLADMYKGIFDSFDDQLYDKLTKIFDSIDPKKPIRTMSKGMQKQAAFILSISCRPSLLILDEPVDGLDPVMRRQIWSILLAEVEQTKMTVLVSSHNLRELEDVCDYVGIMHKGKILLERSLADLQGSVVKLQVAFNGPAPDLGSKLTLLHSSQLGKVYTYIIKGNRQQIMDTIETFNPILADILPLTLEEIFIYELGGENYEIKEIIL